MEIKIFRVINSIPFESYTFVVVSNYFDEPKSNEIWHYSDNKNLEFYKDEYIVGVWKIKQLKQ